MIVRNQSKLESVTRDDNIMMTDFFNAANPGGDGVTMGFAVFPPGVQAPPAAHDKDEYAYILSGKIKVRLAGGEVVEAAAGCATFIPAGEEHASFNDSNEDCRLVWLLVERSK